MGGEGGKNISWAKGQFGWIVHCLRLLCFCAVVTAQRSFRKRVGLQLFDDCDRTTMQAEIVKIDEGDEM